MEEKKSTEVHSKTSIELAKPVEALLWVLNAYLCVLTVSELIDTVQLVMKICR